MSVPHGQNDSPLASLWVAMSGASANDHHENQPGLETKSVSVGHEPDKFDVRGIIYVPIAVVIAIIVTYTVVQISIGFLIAPSTDAVAGRRPFNERIGVISSTEPKSILDEKSESTNKVVQLAVTQPRLEGNREVDRSRPGRPDDPEYMRSFLPTVKGNSPQIYPEDLRPERYVDPKTNKQPLIEYAWLKGHEVAQIPIADAITLLTHNKTLKLASKKGGRAPDLTTESNGKQSNGGVAKPAVKKDDHHDHDHDHEGHKH